MHRFYIKRAFLPGAKALVETLLLQFDMKKGSQIRFTMNIRHTTPFICTLLLLLAGLLNGYDVKGQAICNNPIVFSSILISNATCSNSTGAIILNLGSGAYQFNWTPSVSISNVASNLQAGTYRVEIIRADNPGCRLDTTIIVNNSNGPVVEASSVSPANCLANNGRIVMTPATLTYTWSNGESGAINDGLASGCYYVTATNATGCYTVHKICVPNTNPLESEVIVLQNAKCGLPTGAANVLVTGGSGNYSYTLGPIPPFTGLAAGFYVSGITDVVTGCTDEVSFIVDDIPVNAGVLIQPSNVQCPGGNNGSVSIVVTPGDNFLLPFTALIRDENGGQVLSNNLFPGAYTVLITDADGCQLPLDSFEIETPPLFVSQALIVPVNCDVGGQILLTISGGTGPKQVDWSDLPGSDNPKDRQNLGPGLYSGIVYDSLLCSFSLSPILVSSNCIQTDTIPLVVTMNTLDSFCMELPVGIQPNAVTFSLPGNGGSISGNSIFGSWVLRPDGCLIYAAGNTKGVGVDTICIARSVNQPGLNDTICLVVSIVERNCSAIIDLPASMTVPTTNCQTTTAACFPIPYSEINHFVILDNGQPYAHTLLGCALDTVTAYALSQIPATGPFQLTEWQINGQTVSGNFLNINALLILMNQLDPFGEWTIRDNLFITGGHPNNTYGTLKVLSEQGAQATLTPAEQYIARGSELQFSTGEHRVVFQDVLTECADTVQISVICYECLPIHDYTPDATGVIRWDIADCDGDTVFCSNIMSNGLSDWVITDNQLPFNAVSFCSNNVGLNLETGLHQIQIRNLKTTCRYDFKVNITCDNVVFPTDTTFAVADAAYTNRGITVVIPLLSNDVILGVTGDAGSVSALDFLSAPSEGQYAYNPVTGVLTFSPDDSQCGLVTFTYQITDILGNQSEALVSITVICDKILIYNGISPNGDNLNDDWRLPGIDKYTNNEVRVYNRWGNLVFERKGYTNALGWDGRWNGRDLPDGTYFYLIDLKDGSKVLSGYLQILR